MSRRAIGVGLAVILLVVVVLVWRRAHAPSASTELTLHGNVDLREVALPFNGTERVAEVLVQEGDRVHTGQVLARLDTRRLEPQVAQVAAQTAAQRDVVARLQHGSRPEEVDQARASATSARVDVDNAQRHYARLAALAEQHIVSQQDVDNAQTAVDQARAKLVVSEKILALAVAGPRQEDIAQAEDQLRADEAQLALLRQQLADAALVAPANAIVRSRLMEPGEMASPQKPVFSLAIVDPKWVRAYVAEPDLSRVHPGMLATIAIDGLPGQRLSGWVGFISPVAEFTPKEVQTDALRPGLVYEVRVFVRDSADVLRLGMPATVALSTVSGGAPTDARSTVPIVPPPSPAASSRP